MYARHVAQADRAVVSACLRQAACDVAAHVDFSSVDESPRFVAMRQSERRAMPDSNLEPMRRV
jgi:hypothetical protein